LNRKLEYFSKICIISGRRSVADLFFLTVLSVLALTSALSAHAILLRSTPKPHEVVRSGKLDVVLEFNSRIDAGRSSVTLLLPGGKVENIAGLSQPSPSTLSATTAPLTAGSHSLRWQVLATDGHITRGEIPFDVK
jgi:methionine-rich copper-binding protein CopC